MEVSREVDAGTGMLLLASPAATAVLLAPAAAPSAAASGARLGRERHPQRPVPPGRDGAASDASPFAVWRAAGRPSSRSDTQEWPKPTAGGARGVERFKGNESQVFFSDGPLPPSHKRTTPVPRRTSTDSREGGELRTLSTLLFFSLCAVRDSSFFSIIHCGCHAG